MKWDRDSRDRSWRLRCSLLLKARLQNWHLYFFSGADVFLAGELFAVLDALGAIAQDGAATVEQTRFFSAQ